ncbi:MAG: hypothetical protein WEA24_04900 [Gemmatimonadota bacterium]
MRHRALILIVTTGMTLAAVPPAVAQSAGSPLHADRAASSLVHGPSPVLGQQARNAYVAPPPPLAGMAEDSAAADPDLIMAAFLGAVGGMALGAWIGPELGNQESLGRLAGFVFGMLAGSAVGPPLAVHLANDRRGSLAQGIGAGVVVAAAGIGGVALTHSVIPLLIVPAVQMGVAVSVERRTSPPAEGGG